MVVVGRDTHDAGLLRRPETDREHGSEHDRDLAEDVARMAFADDPPDPVDMLDRLDPAVEDGEERALGAFIRGVLARDERDVGRSPGEKLPLGRAERGKDGDAADLVRRDHS